MIPRYSRAPMLAIWDESARFAIWQDIEVLACEAQAQLGQIPQEAARTIRERAGFDVARIKAIEEETRHDVIAFLTSMAEHIGPEARYVHQGLTSSDILDTATSVQLTRATDLLLEGIHRLLAALKEKALIWKDLPTIGRSHGIHAEPTSFGLKFAHFYAEFQRNRRRLQQARAEVAVCALSGAVGTYAHCDPAVEAYVAGKLNLATEPISTQVIPRDRHGAYFATLGVIASSIERIAIEIRHLQRTELREVEEFFAGGQKGSSAMPHKRNPILSENLTGLARLVRMAVIPALENIPLWHERDISHSSVERVIAPDATITLDFALHRLAGLVEELTVYPEHIQRNLDLLGGLHASQKVMLALTRAGMSREDAYALVQRHAMRAWNQGQNFHQAVQQDPAITRHIRSEALADLFSTQAHLQHVDTIYARVFQD